MVECFEKIKKLDLGFADCIEVDLNGVDEILRAVVKNKKKKIVLSMDLKNIKMTEEDVGSFAKELMMMNNLSQLKLKLDNKLAKKSKAFF